MTTDRVDIRIDIQQQGAQELGRLNNKVAELAQVGLQADAAFVRITQDIRQATVDYQKGSLSVQGYADALRFARTEAAQFGIDADRLESSIQGVQARFQQQRETLSQFTARTQGATVAAHSMAGGMNAVNRSATRAARQGLGTMRSSLASLVAMTVGARGTFGTLGGALLQFGAGNTIALGAIAGLGAIALAVRKLTEDARESKKAIDESITSIEKLIASRADAQRAAAVQRVTNIEAKITELEGLRDRLLDPTVTGAGGQALLIANAVELARLRSSILPVAVQEIPRMLPTPQAVRLGEGARAELAALNVQIGLLVQAATPTIRTKGFVPGELPDFMGDAEGARRASEAAEANERLQEALEKLGIAAAKTADQAELASARMILAFGRIAESLIRSEGGINLSGVFGLASGILSAVKFANPLVGAAAIAGTGVLSTLTRGGRDGRPVSVNVNNVRDIAAALRENPTGPDNVRVIVVTATGAVLADVQKRIDEVSQLNGEDVLAGVRVSG